jgi:PAS domain S-box-containing protein
LSTPSLDEAAKRMLLAVQGTNDGLWDWDLVSNEVYLSSRWKEMLGFGDAELPNSYDTWRERVHPEDLPVALAALQRHLDESTSCYQLEYRLRHKDGSYRWFFLHGGTLRDAGGAPLRVFCWHTDISERKQAEAQRLRWMALRAEVSQVLTERSSLSTILQRCCQALEDQLQVAWALIWLVEEGQASALNLSASSSCTPALLDEQRHDPTFALSLGRIAWQQQPYLTNDVPNDPSLGPTGWIERERITAFAGYPLLVEERVVGVMALFSRERFIPETLELLALLANAIAQGIGRKWAEKALEERVQQQTRELELLLEFGHSAPSSRNLSALLNRLLEQLKIVVDYSGAALYWIQDDRLSLLAGTPDTEIYRLMIQEALPEAPGQQREPIIVSDLHTDPNFGQLYLRILELVPHGAWQFRSWMIVPLLVQEQVLAILVFNHERPHAYTPQQARYAGALATQAAFFAVAYPRLATQAHTYASFMERMRSVRELHEVVAAHLRTIQICCAQIKEALVIDTVSAMAPLRTALLLTRIAQADLHALDVELRPELLETEGLIVALKRILAAIRLRQNVPLEELMGSEPVLPVNSKYALYRIAQQALYQVSGHALASAIMLRLEQEEQTVVLEVRAAGTAFEVPGWWLSRPVLQIIRKYTDQLDADLSIDEDSEHGTTLSVRFQLPGASAPAAN